MTTRYCFGESPAVYEFTGETSIDAFREFMRTFEYLHREGDAEVVHALSTGLHYIEDDERYVMEITAVFGA